MKKALFPIITDLHIDESNYLQVRDVVIQSIDKCIEHLLKTLYVAGDIFNSRKSQPLVVLDCWSEILDYAQMKGVELIGIPGNHDKLDYTSEKSYLDSYKHHPAFTLVRDYGEFDIIEGVRVHMVPYFDEKSTYMQYLSQVNLLKGGKNYLITHIAVNGVRNNDGSTVEQSIPQDIFSQFDAVYVGHYHDRQLLQVGGGFILYIGALLQRNYGEDVNKGMTLVFDDGTNEIVNLKFKQFITLDVDLDQVSDEQLKHMCIQNGNSDDNVRIKFTGSKQKIDALDKSKFDAVNIDVKCKYKDPEIDISYKQAVNFSGFDADKIKVELEDFCQKNPDIELITAQNYLQKTL